MDIKKVLIQVKDKYEECPYDINNGLCEDFAMGVIELMGGYSDDLYELTSDNFTDDNFNLIPKYLGNYGRLNSLNPKEVDMGSHVWIYFKGKHYDAECMEGVINLFDLPFYKRKLER